MNAKKKFTLVITIVALTVVLSCKKALESITFTKDYTNLTFVIDTTSFVGEMTLGESDVNVDITQRLEEAGFTTVNVKEAYVKSVKVECLTPEQTFNFIRRASLRISGEFDNALIIAEKEFPETHALREFTLDVNNLNLNDFFKYPTMTFRLTALTDLPIEIETTVRVSAKFEIKAGI
jgi:polyisoprenoid-binding protein YceI